MKRTFAYLAAGLLTLTLTACSSLAATDKTDTTPAADATAKTTETAKPATAANYGKILADAFRDKGYQITDRDTEADEYGFDATSNLGRLEISVETGNAQADYNEATASFTDEDFFEEQTWNSSQGYQMTRYLNSMNTIYNIAAMDTNNNVFYEIEDIAEADKDQVVEIMNSIGF
ncbi:hypothetical protein [Faecalibaculum rodentium]|uniref:hypothetical protein n=1 Tax=Faecalibaculum rodentium TaxID=1702221 RepID=UPI0023F05A1D|nr:hypothetical protein [Faecalibaculum rodentium]